MAITAGTDDQPVRKPRRRLRAEERWEQILAVSAELFSSKGYHGASLDDIGERLGIQKAALYHYVRSKEDIIVEIYERMLTQAETEVLPLASEPYPPDERLRRMVSKYVQLMLSHADMWSLIHYQQNALPAATHKEKLRRYRAFERTFETVIKEGQVLGIFKPMPSRLMALSLFGMCNYVYQWIQFAHFSQDDITGVICEVLEHGFIDDGGKRTGAWPRYAEPSDVMEDTAAKLAALNEQVKELQGAFERDRLRLLDGFAGTGSLGAGGDGRNGDSAGAAEHASSSPPRKTPARKRRGPGGVSGA